ncbi:MAG: aminopeptidase P family protein [Prevotella sp.]|nr:aminopeptidase P family protein [Prevotella sp.]
MQNKSITSRVDSLRKIMRQRQLDAFIFPSNDPHSGEYIPDYWKAREWISGFNGSAGVAVVTADKAALWTDSRYFIAAEEQLKGTGYVLMKERIPGTPSIAEWLTQVLKGNAKVGIDGEIFTISAATALEEELCSIGDLKISVETDPLKDIWTDRPAIPVDKVMVQPLEYAGETAESKISRIRKEMAAKRVDALLVSTLDDIAWTLNMRGTDVHCNPVFVAYLLIGHDDATLFVNPEKLTAEVANYLDGIGVSVDRYESVVPNLSQYGPKVWMDAGTTNCSIAEAPKVSPVFAASPIPAMKAVKNPVEIEGYRNAMTKDGVAMVKFLCWLDKAMSEDCGEKQTELSIDKKLTAFRAEQPLFKGISFDTIAGYGPHGAIVHYEATEETDVELERRGFLLLDSGAQYLDGTTDITRTISLGPLTEEEKKVYTLVLKGHLRLQNLKFPTGACGSQLDAIARSPLWEAGLNYLHGTGHGVGAFLNVHEGPHQIRMEWKPAPLVAGMTVTDEPGVYVEGRFGVRIENTLLIVPYQDTDFGSFLQFEPLTLCPIDLKPVDFSLLTEKEKKWLNQYHAMVRQRLSPLLDEEHRQWLEKATREIE